MTRLRTFDVDSRQLELIHDLDRAEIVKIWQLLWDDLTDHWVVLVACDDRTATWISLN